jgi:hypothetical protein
VRPVKAYIKVEVVAAATPPPVRRPDGRWTMGRISFVGKGILCMSSFVSAGLFTAFGDLRRVWDVVGPRRMSWDRDY